MRGGISKKGYAKINRSKYYVESELIEGLRVRMG